MGLGIIGGDWRTFKCRELAEKGVGRVFATDALITTLMCATRSVYSWDIIVERQGDFLFFDKRDGSNLDLLTGRTPSSQKGFSRDGIALPAVPPPPLWRSDWTLDVWSLLHTLPPPPNLVLEFELSKI
jgi:hypothetical protein